MQYSRPKINFVFYGVLVLASHVPSTLGQFDQEAFHLAAQRSVAVDSRRLHSAHQIGRPSGPGGSHLANGGKIFGTPTYYSGDSAMGTGAASGPGGSHLANGGKIIGTPTYYSGDSAMGTRAASGPGGSHLANGGKIFGTPTYYSGDSAMGTRAASGPGGSHLANGGKIIGTPTYYSGDSSMGSRAASGPGGSHLANGGKIFGTPTNSGGGANELADPPGWSGSYRPLFPGNGSSGGKHLANGGYVSDSRPTGYGRPVFFSKSLRFPIPTQLGDFNVEVGMKVYAPDNGNDLVIDRPEMITGGRPSGLSQRPDPAEWARTTKSYSGGQPNNPTGFNPHSTTGISAGKYSSPTRRPCPAIKPLSARETKCQKESREAQESMCRDNVLGGNVPSCKSNGDYETVQRMGGTQVCVDRDGKAVQGSGTSIGLPLNCSEFVNSDGSIRIKVVSRLPSGVQSTPPSKQYSTGHNPTAMQG